MDAEKLATVVQREISDREGNDGGDDAEARRISHIDA